MKRLFSVIMVFVVLIASAPLSCFKNFSFWDIFGVSASAETTAGGSCGFNVEWYFYESTCELVINAYNGGYMDDYSLYGGQPWEEYIPLIKRLIISDGVGSLGTFAFYNCTELEDVYYLGEINEWCSITFAGSSSHPMVNAKNLYINDELMKGDIIIPGNVNTIRDYAFYNCKDITSIAFSEGVKNLCFYTFYECSGLKSVTLPTSLSYIGESSFEGCKRITNVKYNGTEEEWGSVFVDYGNDELLNAEISFANPDHECEYGEWKIVAEPTATESGSKNHTCTICGETEVATIPSTGFDVEDGVLIDFTTNTISGFNAGETSLGNYTTVVNDNYAWNYETDNDRIGTGSKAILKDGNTVIGEYTILVYGDTNGDAWYDGQDAIIVDCIANGMLDEDNVSSVVYKAADCNHDGIIDALDVALLNEAGTLVKNIDQSETVEILLETSSDYIEYIELIDQSPEIDIDAPIKQDEDKTETDIIGKLVNFIKSIIEKFFEYILLSLR